MCDVFACGVCLVFLPRVLVEELVRARFHVVVKKKLTATVAAAVAAVRYGDIGVFGRENISTPHVDSLAHDGLKLTQWLSAAPICTPSRAGLQTGRLAHRFGMTANVEPWRVFMMPCQPGGFPPEELTIAEVQLLLDSIMPSVGRAICSSLHAWIAF